MKKLVCIGGPADGVRGTPDFNGYRFLDESTKKTHVYRPVRFVFDGIESWALFEHGHTPKDLIGDLLAGYRKQQRI